jgi:Putative Flp pilus-assembly TadE/G-like
MRKLSPHSLSLSSLAHAANVPDKFAELEFEPERRGAHRGQVLILFAGFLVGLMGMLGLATDVGYTLAARRTVQGAADAGAIAGARAMARYQSSAPTSAQADVNSLVASNTFGSKTPTVDSCEYIGAQFNVVGTCSQTVPSNAAGTRVKTKLTVDTFFIKVVPGAPKTVTVRGYAKARVQNASVSAPAAPFIICGYQAWDVTSSPSANNKNAGVDTDILSSESPMRISQSAVGEIFRVHDSQLKHRDASCGTSSADWKGLNDQNANEGKPVPGWLNYDNGTQAGPTREKVNGAEGCAANVGEPYNCVMLLPVAKVGSQNNSLYIVGYAAFKITSVGSNTHNAQLLDDFIVTGSGATTGWCRDCGGPVLIRLIW